MSKKKFQPLITPGVQWTKASLTNTFGECVAQPLESGFGITLGNALRRVLLGGIEGCAVTAVIIDGVNNEFSSLHGVVEDTLHILLNIKQLIIRNDSGAVGVMRLEASGLGPVTAGSIVPDAHLEILNKDLVIANLARDGRLSIEFHVECGRGYRPAAWPLDKAVSEDGKIYLDATFSPVRQVTFDVQKTRIGKNIDYDKLILSITTDGTESPVSALTYAISVIRNQLVCFLEMETQEIVFPLQAVAGFGPVLEGPGVVASNALVESERSLLASSSVAPDFFLKSIDVLGLPVRAHNCLASAGINRIIDLVNMTEQQVVTIKNFGKKSYEDLVQIMREFGLSFDMRIQEKDIIDLARNTHETSKK